MLRASQAVRLGLRAASRNPELSFAKALLDQGGNLLAILPLALGAVLLAAIARGEVLRAATAALRAILALRWPVLGGIATALVIAFAGSMLFWAGAVPLLAADAELDRRPPPGNFLVLLSRGAARTIVAGALGWGLAVLFTLACEAAAVFGIPAALLRPSPILFAAFALLVSVAVTGTFLLDALARLTIVRAAAFGDAGTTAFGKAISLLGARLGAAMLITLVFVGLELIGATFFNLPAELLALAPRAAIGLAAAAVFGWLEVARMGAFAALAADAEGLIAPEAPPEPAPVAELVVEALPVEE